MAAKANKKSTMRNPLKRFYKWYRNTKVGHIVRPPKYFRNAFAEFKKVTWPSRKEAWKLTIAVFIFSGFFALLIALADIVFKEVAERVFL